MVTKVKNKKIDEEVVELKKIFDESENDEKQIKQDHETLPKKCPECGKIFKPAGLLGHLRFKHLIPMQEALKLVDDAKPDMVDKAKKIFALIDRLKGIRIRLKELDKMDKSDFFSSDKTVDELREGLEQEEINIREELKSSKGEIDERSELDQMLSPKE